MPLEEPVLCKRIPTPPWGDPAKRKRVTYAHYVKTGGYEPLRKALEMTSQEVIAEVKEAELRGRFARRRGGSGVAAAALGA